ncbi:MAG: cell division protein FtsA [Bacilli bacterium]|nr:cell division protein FtsA [Bacilli bacterium]
MVRHIYTSIDIGTDTIKVVVTEIHKGKLNLLAASSTKSKGIKKGLVTDVNDASASLKSAINEVEEMLGIKIKKVLISVPSYFAEFTKIEGKIKINNDDSIITGYDIRDVLEVAIKNNSFPKEIVSVIPIDFKIDDQTGIKDPKGLMGSVLSVRAIACLTPKKNIYSVITLADSIGLEVMDIMLNGIGDVNAFKNAETESKLGAIINIGCETTSISIYNKGIVIKNSIIGMGGKNIDNDISYMYKIEPSEATKIKEKFALAHKKNANINEFYTIKNLDNKKINQLEVTEIVMSRIEEILGLAKKEINSLANRKMDYIIITGGTSNIKDFITVAEEIFDKNIAIGNINIIGLRNNKYSTAIGNIIYYINKLKLLGNNISFISDTELNRLSLNGLVNVSSESMLGKVFGYFFGETNEEEI